MNFHFWLHISFIYIKTLTLESVAQSLQSVGPWYTTRLSSDAPGSPAGRGQSGKPVYVTDGLLGQKL